MAGADGVKEVIEKFTAQEETHRTLVELSRGSQSRIDALKVQRAEAKKALERARYAGGPIAMPEGGEGEEGGEGGKGGEGGEAAAAVNGVEERVRRHEAAQLQAQRERQRAQRLHRVSGKIVEVRSPSPIPPSSHPPTLSTPHPPTAPPTHPPNPPHRHAWPSST